jgi:hypothetical protein
MLLYIKSQAILSLWPYINFDLGGGGLGAPGLKGPEPLSNKVFNQSSAPLLFFSDLPG